MKQFQFLHSGKKVLVAASIFFSSLHTLTLNCMPTNVEESIPTVGIPPIPQDQPISVVAPVMNSVEQGPETVAFSEDKVGAQGNWMKKREWLIKSNEIFDEIESVAFAIQETRKSFNAKYHAVDEELDNFYRSQALEHEKLQELFVSIMEYIEKQKKKKIEELSGQAREKLLERDYIIKIDLFNAEINKHKEGFEQLKLNFKSIDEIDKSIIDRLNRVNEQIAQAKIIFDQARVIIDDLWSIIDDKKARAIYYNLKGTTLEQLKSILTYLKDDLSSDFDLVAEKIRSQIQNAKTLIKQLEEKGFIIKNRSERLAQIKIQEKEKLAKKEIVKIPTKEEVIDLQKIKNPSMRWYEKMYDNIITFIVQIYRIIGSFFGGNKIQKKMSVSDKTLHEDQVVKPPNVAPSFSPVAIVGPTVQSTPVADVAMPVMGLSTVETVQPTIPPPSSPDFLGGMPLN